MMSGGCEVDVGGKGSTFIIILKTGAYEEAIDCKDTTYNVVQSSWKQCT